MYYLNYCVQNIYFWLEILAYFAFHHLLQNSFYPQNNQHQNVFNFFNSLSRSKSFDLFLVTLSLMSFNLASKSVFVTKLLTSGILFSTDVNAELVPRPLILGILPSTSVMLESKFVF